MQTAAGLPVAIFALAAGAIADTYDRRSVMLLALSMTLGVSVILAVCEVTGVLTANLLLALTFLIGCCLALYLPAWQTSVSDQTASTDVSATRLSRSSNPA